MTERPLLLQASAGNGVVAVRVEARSGMVFLGAYRLDVECGGNRSTHRVTVSSAHRENAILSNIAVGHASGAPWSATLTVEQANGEHYVERAGS